MSFRVTTMPDEPELLAKWLEQQLVADRLHELVDELAAIHGISAGDHPLRELWTDALPRLLQSGLTVLDEPQIRLLLTKPQYLIELQELVFTDGGEYWGSVERPPSLESSVIGQWSVIRAALPVAEASAVPEKINVRRRPNPWLVMVATAAAVLVVVAGVERLRSKSTPAQAGWGWSKPDALPQDADAQGYFAALADGGQAWFDRRPDDRLALAKRLNELRQGCSFLILAEHRPLNGEQRAWLKERCRTWAAKFDAALVKLEAGGESDEIRSVVDGVVRALIDTLKTKSNRL